MSDIRREFQVHILNDGGIAKAKRLAEAFSKLLTEVEETVDEPGLPPYGANRRELALVRTHLELAAFYAKRAMAMTPENQKHEVVDD